MAIIIGDIHGDLTMARAFLAHKPDVEHVALGDLIDATHTRASFEDELACLDLLLASESILLWGNHDLAYLDKAPWDFLYGRTKEQRVVIRDRYQVAVERFKAAHAVDGWLCTHAGVSEALAADLADAPFDGGEMSAIAAWLDAEFQRQLEIPRPPDNRGRRWHGGGPLFKCAMARGGNDQYGGIFWYDHRWEPANPPDPWVRQIFAHTRVEGPMRKGNWINVHIEGGSGYWVFDTEADDFTVLRP